MAVFLVEPIWSSPASPLYTSDISHQNQQPRNRPFGLLWHRFENELHVRLSSMVQVPIDMVPIEGAARGPPE
jgi:hypothetical protein